MATINEKRGKVQEIINLSSSDEEIEHPKEKSKVELMAQLGLNGPVSMGESSKPSVRTVQASELLISKNKMVTGDLKSEVTSDSTSENDLVNKFVTTLCNLMTEDERKVLKVIYDLRDKCQPNYLKSKEFEELINTTLSKAASDVQNIFVYIKEVYDEMKAYSQKAKLKHQNGSSKSTDSEPSTSKLKAEGEEADERQIRRLEKLMGRLDRKIRRLKRKEITLDEMDDNCSAYIYEDKLSKRLVKVWQMLCKLKKRSPSLGNHQEKKFHFQASRYPELNSQVEKFLNTTKIFPDFTDMLKITREVNEGSALGLSEPMLHNLAKEVFEDVGKELQSRRLRDQQELFGSYLTDNLDSQNDPAEADPELQEILKESFFQGQQNLDQLLRKYTDQQCTLKLEPKEVAEEESLEPSDQDDNEEDREIEQEQILDEAEGGQQALDDDSLHDDDAKSHSSSEESNLSLILEEDSHSDSTSVSVQSTVIRTSTSKVESEFEPEPNIHIINVSSLANSETINKLLSKSTKLQEFPDKSVIVDAAEEYSNNRPAKKLRLESPGCDSYSEPIISTEQEIIELD